jgi:hypothetical protein
VKKVVKDSRYKDQALFNTAEQLLDFYTFHAKILEYKVEEIGVGLYFHPRIPILELSGLYRFQGFVK